MYRLGKMFGEYYIQIGSIIYINNYLIYHEGSIAQVEKILFLKGIGTDKLQMNGDEIEIDKQTFNILNKILTYKSYPYKSHV